MRLKHFIAGVGGLLIAVGIGLTATWKVLQTSCEPTCGAPAAYWISGIICVSIGLVTMLGALIVDDGK